jgi:IMP cyclohydrolase
MYVGRIVVVGRSRGRDFVAYRVSSRSFPNRRAEVRNKGILVSPIDPADLARNPYIAYNCIRVLDEVAVVSNGTQTDMILEKIEDGLRPLDAIALSLVSYGFEKDELDTPRIAGAIRGDRAWMGIAKRDEYRVQEFELQDGQAIMVATYEETEFKSISLVGQNATEIARSAYDLSFERPVCAAAALTFLQGDGEKCNGFDLAVYNPK